MLIPTFLFDWCSVIDWYERARKWNKVGAVLYANSFLYEMGFFSVASTVIAVHDVLTEHKKELSQIAATANSQLQMAAAHLLFIPADHCLQQFNNSEICSYAFSSLPADSTSVCIVLGIVTEPCFVYFFSWVF